MHILTKWREQNGISLHELGRRAGIGHTQIMRIERGDNSPRSTTAKRIEAATNGEVTAAELLGLTESKGVREDAAPFTPAPALADEARQLGLDPDAIAAKAVEDAVKRKRIDAWIEDNREAMEAHAEDIRKNGMWSDGLRLF